MKTLSFQVFVDAGGKAPAKIKLFPAKSDKSSTGLLEWETKADAIESLMCANHVQIPNPTGKYPYTLKLCFSANPIMG
ncbi:Heterogeneous nuclear ribonucleoprotein L [Lamellibrachia satsuma]|nr:Heterogeneous nuclear ribonucleoprotein L [Lamellibrachia satsuma]